MKARLTGALFAMLALLAAGLSTGTRIYYLLFYLIACMLGLGLASAVWALATVKIDIKGVKSRVTRGDTLMMIFTIRHAALLPVASIRIRLNVPSACTPEQEISVYTQPFAKKTFRHMILCPHRGIYDAGVTRIAAHDIFGFFSLCKKPNMKLIRMEVLPRLNEAQPMILKASDTGPEFISRASEDNASPSDVRAWQDGDSLKKVHWKLTMRRREVMVRTYEESARPDTLIIPDLAEITALRDRQLTIEDCICEACLAQAKAQLDAGYPVRMPLTAAQPAEITGQFPPDIGAFTDAMMRVKFDSPYAYEKVLMLMLGRMQRTGGAVLVSSRLTTRIADVAMRMQRSGIRTQLIWVSDDAREETLEMLERVKMQGVETRRIDPWQPAPSGAGPADDGLEF